MYYRLWFDPTKDFAAQYNYKMQHMYDFNNTYMPPTPLHSPLLQDVHGQNYGTPKNLYDKQAYLERNMPDPLHEPEPLLGSNDQDFSVMSEVERSIKQHDERMFTDRFEQFDDSQDDDEDETVIFDNSDEFEELFSELDEDPHEELLRHLRGDEDDI